VAGNGTVHIVNNPRPKSAFPYAIKIRSNDREVFGPERLQCLAKRKEANDPLDARRPRARRRAAALAAQSDYPTGRSR
jgi:hypothetical protein